MRNPSEKLRTSLLKNGMRKFWFAGTAVYRHPRDSVPEARESLKDATMRRDKHAFMRMIYGTGGIMRPEKQSGVRERFLDMETVLRTCIARNRHEEDSS